MHTYCIEEHKAPNKKFGLYLSVSTLFIIIGILLISMAHVYYPTDTNSLLITDVFGSTMIVLGIFLSLFLILEKNEKIKFNGEHLVYEVLFHKKVATPNEHYVTFSEKTNTKDKSYMNLLVYRKGDKEINQEPYFVYSFEIKDNNINNIVPILQKWVPLLKESEFEVHMSKGIADIASKNGISINDITIYHAKPPFQKKAY